VLLRNRPAILLDERLASAEARFDQRLEDQREELIEQGRRRAKRKLRKIDPTFSARNIDPQDVTIEQNINLVRRFISFHPLGARRGFVLDGLGCRLVIPGALLTAVGTPPLQHDRAKVPAYVLLLVPK
jgi:hypothetical protein